MAALRKDPQERYATVEQFADDLQAFLESRTVRARSGNTWYRTHKFLRRHWAPLALTAAVFQAILGGIVATSIEASNARRQRDFALAQLSRSETLSDVYGFLLTETPPEAFGQAMQLAEQVARRGFNNDLASKAELLLWIAVNTPVDNGDSKVREIMREAYDLSRGLRDPSIRARAACYLAAMTARGGEWVRGEKFLQEGLKELPWEPQFMLDRSFCLLRGAAVSRSRGNASEALARNEAARSALKQSPVQPELMQAQLLMDLGDSYRLGGRNREAGVAFEEALGHIAALGRDNTGLAGTTHYRWSVALTQLGRPREAEKLSIRAMWIFGSGENDESLPPFMLANHARIVSDLGRLEEATRRAERAYARAQQAAEQSSVNQTLLLRASIYRMRGDLRRAAEMMSELEPRLRGLPPGNIAFASFDREQAFIAEARGDLPAAAGLVNHALAIAEAEAKAGRQGADWVPSLLLLRSDIERKLMKLDAASADASQALTFVQNAAQPGTSSTTVAKAYLTLGLALQAKGQREPARTAFRSAADQFSSSLGADHADTRSARELAQVNVTR